MITLENGILGYLYSVNDIDTGLIEDIDAIFFFVFVVIWVIGQLMFIRIGVRTKASEMKKLTMGTTQLMKLEGEEDSSKNYYFYRKEVTQTQYNDLNQLNWMTLMGHKRE